MYNACPAVTNLWASLVKELSRTSGVPLRFEIHPYPLDIESLWGRQDLGLVFICGRAFALGGMRHRALAVPLRGLPDESPDNSDNAASSYHTKILVHRDSPFMRIEDIFDKRIGWTVKHSMSGYFALKRHLENRSGKDVLSLSTKTAIPLHTPTNCLKALKNGTVDAVPLDGYFYDLLLRNVPVALDHTRVIDITREYPMPFLAASPQISDVARTSLQLALRSAAKLPPLEPVLNSLGLKGFSEVISEDYAFMAENGDEPDEPAKSHRAKAIRNARHMRPGFHKTRSVI
jgi:ABC-type phosphate/phosphonate transport system substrate-binding protein